MVTPYEINADELKPLLEKNEIQLLDVRTQEERQKFNIGGLWIPITELPQRLEELNQTLPIVVYCQSGIRSINAVKLLHAAKFMSARSLRGGMNGWH